MGMGRIRSAQVFEGEARQDEAVARSAQVDLEIERVSLGRVEADLSLGSQRTGGGAVAEVGAEGRSEEATRRIGTAEHAGRIEKSRHAGRLADKIQGAPERTVGAR